MTNCIKTKKRKRIIIENMDGTIEEFKEGILFTFLPDEYNNEVNFVAKHINTKGKLDKYVRGLAYASVHMIDNLDDLKEIYDDHE